MEENKKIIIKTAKELCKDLKAYKDMMLQKELEDIITEIKVNYGIINTLNSPRNIQNSIERNKDRLDMLGYKVEYKTQIHKFPGFFPWSKPMEIPQNYYIISANCECEK